MIYVLFAFTGLALFLLGLVLGYISPLSTEKSMKKSGSEKKARALNQSQKEIQNFLNYDGSPRP